MPQAALAYGGSPNRLICKFGGAALPNGQGTLAQIDLNDSVSWFVDPLNVDIQISRQLTTSPVAWRAESAWLGDDFFPAVVKLKDALYVETVQPIGAAKAALLMAGEQRLTFDNNTYITAILQDFEPVPVRRATPLMWRGDLQFLCREPWFRDFNATSIASTTVVSAPTAAPSGSAISGGGLAVGTYTLTYTYVTASGETATSPASSNITTTSSNKQISVSAVTPLPSWATAVKWYFATGPTTGFTVQNSGGAFTLNTAGSGAIAPSASPATAFSVSYAGSIWGKPVWTFTIPSSNAATIAGLVLTNTMSGEALTVAFPGNLPASTAATVTIDCSDLSVIDAHGVSYDATGTFPLLYGPAGQSNPFTVAVTPGSGTPVGCTIAGSVINRWIL